MILRSTDITDICFSSPWKKIYQVKKYNYIHQNYYFDAIVRREIIVESDKKIKPNAAQVEPLSAHAHVAMQNTRLILPLLVIE